MYAKALDVHSLRCEEHATQSPQASSSSVGANQGQRGPGDGDSRPPR